MNQRDRTRGRDMQAVERARNVEARTASMMDEAQRLCDENPDETRPPLRAVLELAVPIQNLGEWLTELEFRHPTIADLRAVEHLDEDTQSIQVIETMIRRLTALKGEAVSRLSACDTMAAGELIAGFYHRRPALKPEPEL